MAELLCVTSWRMASASFSISPHNRHSPICNLHPPPASCSTPHALPSITARRGRSRTVRVAMASLQDVQVAAAAAAVSADAIGGHLPVGLVENTPSAAVAVAGGAAIAAASLIFADPEKRRQQQAAEAGGEEKDAVKNYFNSSGFERWKRIYGDAEDLNSVQADIREGHALTIEKVLRILREGRPLQGVRICDAGCGTGSLAIPLALEGAIVNASDISSAMVAEAEKQAFKALSEAKAKPLINPKFFTQDLESISGEYDTVACLDVLIHYPQERAGAMIAHLASLAQNRLILSFAPKTLYFSMLKRIGELFPGPSKATRAYLHAEEDVEAALRKAGWIVQRREMTSTKFYFSRLLEAVPLSSQ